MSYDFAKALKAAHKDADRHFDARMVAEREARWGRVVLSFIIGLPAAMNGYRESNFPLVYYAVGCVAVGLLWGWALAYRTRMPQRGAEGSEVGL